MADKERADGRSTLIRMYGPIVIILAFFIQGDIASLSRVDRWSLAMSLILGLIMLETVFDFVESRFWRLAAVSVALIAGGAVWDNGFRASNASERANDRRCLAIQRDMLSAHPRRSDGPDLFSALHCRPQGEGGVYAPHKPASL